MTAAAFTASAGAVDGAAKQLVESQHAVAIVEIQAAKPLVREMPQPGYQERLRIRRAADAGARGQRLLEVTPREQRYGPEHVEPRGADPLFREDRGAIGIQQLTQGAEPGEQPVGDAGTPGTVAARTQQQAEQFGVSRFTRTCAVDFRHERSLSSVPRDTPISAFSA